MRNLSILCLFCFATLIVSGQSVGDRMRHANAVRTSGEYHDAIALYDSIILSTEDNLVLFECFGNRAYCHKMLSNYSLALADYNQALHIVTKGPDYQRVMLNKSDLLLQMGQYNQAEQLLQDLGKLNGSMESIRVSNLSAALINQEKRDEAFALLNKLINDSITDNDTRAAALQNRGFAYMDIPNRSADAVNDLSKALTSLIGPRKYIVLANLATAQSLNNQYAEALTSIDQVLAWQKDNLGVKHPDYIISMRKKAEILLRMGRRHDAQVWFKYYFDAERSHISGNFVKMTEQQRIDLWKKDKPLIGEIFALENDCPEFLLDVALFRREIALLGAQDTARRMSKRLDIKVEDVLRSIKDNEVAIDFVCYPKYNSLTKADEEYYGALVVNPRKHGQEVVFVPLWSANELNSFRLRNGRTLYKAACSNSRGDKDTIYNDSILAQFIWETLIKHLPSGVKVYFAPDGLLHLLAIEYLPLKELEQKDVELHRVTSIARLIERKKVQSISKQCFVAGGLDYDHVDLNEVNIGGKANHDAVDYLNENKKGWFFGHLIGAKNEADDISIQMDNATVTYSQTEKMLKANVGAFSWIHLSTHGYALHVDAPPVPIAMRDSVTLDKSLLASGIALTGANKSYKFDSIDDGILSARELCDMDLHNVDFFVLSACQTALGQLSDEGPAGLVRGLKKAGVKTILATLWSINDVGTQKLMSRFYSNLSNGMTKHQALAQAQQWLRQQKGPVPVFNPEIQCDEYPPKGSPDYREMLIFNFPYFWAPFILIDDIE